MIESMRKVLKSSDIFFTVYMLKDVFHKIKSNYYGVDFGFTHFTLLPFGTT